MYLPAFSLNTNIKESSCGLSRRARLRQQHLPYARVCLLTEQKKSSVSDSEYRGRDISRGTTSIYRFLTIAAFSSVSQHSCSMTGTPVAAYLRCLVRCTAHRMNSVQSFPLPRTNRQLSPGSIRTYLFLLRRICSLLILIFWILPLYSNKVKSYFCFFTKPCA